VSERVEYSVDVVKQSSEKQTQLERSIGEQRHDRQLNVGRQTITAATWNSRDNDTHQLKPSLPHGATVTMTHITPAQTISATWNRRENDTHHTSSNHHYHMEPP